MIPLEQVWVNKERNAENNIIIIDSTLRKILPSQLKNMTDKYKVMCSCGCFISAKIIHFSLLTWSDCHLKHLKDRSHNSKNRRSGEISSCIFETYNISVRPHACHIYNTAADVTMPTMCPCTSKRHRLRHCKCVFSFFL